MKLDQLTRDLGREKRAPGSAKRRKRADSGLDARAGLLGAQALKGGRDLPGNALQSAMPSLVSAMGNASVAQLVSGFQARGKGGPRGDAAPPHLSDHPADTSRGPDTMDDVQRSPIDEQVARAVLGGNGPVDLMLQLPGALAIVKDEIGDDGLFDLLRSQEPGGAQKAKGTKPGQGAEPGQDAKPGKDAEPGQDAKPGRDAKPGKDGKPGKDAKPGKDSKGAPQDPATPAPDAKDVLGDDAPDVGKGVTPSVKAPKGQDDADKLVKGGTEPDAADPGAGPASAVAKKGQPDAGAAPAVAKKGKDAKEGKDAKKGGPDEGVPGGAGEPKGKTDKGAEPAAAPGKAKTPGPGGPAGAAPTTAPSKAPAPSPTSSGPTGTIDEYMKSHPDPDARTRVDNLVSVKDKVGRDAKGFHANIPKPPEKGWLSAINPSHDWFAAKKALDGNKWKGQDDFLSFVTQLSAGIDFVSGLASKIGLVATIGGAILTLLIPPVGAFLLTVGRVANAVSLVCSALKLVISIVKTVVLAVKVAREKDPHKRLEMMQEMKASIQSGVMAGIDIILSKIGGKAKAGAKSAGSKAFSAAKAAYKKGGLKAAVKTGVKELGKGVKTAFKEGVKGLRNKAKLMKELGVGGTLKAMGKSMKGAVSDGLVKPFKELKSAWKGFSGTKKQFKDFFSQVKANGGGLGGYKKTLGQINFPNASKATGFKDKLKALKTDLLDKQGGGYATQVAMGMEGKEDKAGRHDNRSDVQRYVAKQDKALASLKAAKGDRQKTIDALTDEKGGALAEGIKDKHKTIKKGDLGKRLTAKKHGALTEHDDDTLQDMLDRKVAQTQRESSLLGVGDRFDMGVDMAKAALDKDASLVKTGLSHMGKGGGQASKMMAGSKTAGEAAKPGMLKQAAGDNTKATGASSDALTKLFHLETMTGKPLATYMQSQRKQPQGGPGVTGAKVQKILASAIPALGKRADELNTAMAGKGQGGGDAKAPQPPPAPKDGEVVPAEELVPAIDQAVSDQQAEKKQIEEGVKKSEEMRAEALKGIDMARQYEIGLKKQEKGIAKESQEADKDIADLKMSKDKIKDGGAQVKANRDKAEGQKDKAETKRKEGAGVDVKADEAKKKERERKKAEKERREWESEYRSAGFLKRRWMEAKKFLFSMVNLLKKAAAWVWKKLIAPAIAAAKKAMAKVMGFITDLIMSGVMGIVKLFMSKEDKAALDETMAHMKEIEAQQAKAQALEAKKKNEDAQVELTKAEKKAKGESERCDGNVKTGKALVRTINDNDKALKTEKEKVEGGRKAFEAKYKPHFDWMAEQQKKADAGAGKDDEPGGGDPKHPVDKPLDASVTDALSQAGDVVIEQSKASEEEVEKASGEYRDKLKDKAKEQYDEEARDIKVAAAEAGDALARRATLGVLKPKLDDAVGGIYQGEEDKVAAVEKAADDVHDKIAGEQARNEQARRKRVEGLKGEVKGLAGRKGAEAINKARAVSDQLAKEAAGVDDAKAAAYKDLLDAYVRAAKTAG